MALCVQSWNEVPYISFPGKQTLGRQFACRTLMGGNKGSSVGQREKLDWNVAQQRSQPSQRGALELWATLQSCPCLRQGDQAFMIPPRWPVTEQGCPQEGLWPWTLPMLLAAGEMSASTLNGDLGGPLQHQGYALQPIWLSIGDIHIWIISLVQGHRARSTASAKTGNSTKKLVETLGASIVPHAIFWDP